MRRCALCDHEYSAHVPSEGCMWGWHDTVSESYVSCPCTGYVERDRPAIQLSLGENPWATLERQLEEAQAELLELKKKKGR